MRRARPPLRFLGLAVGLWVCIRSAMLAPGWWVEEGAASPATTARVGPASQPPIAARPEGRALHPHEGLASRPSRPVTFVAAGRGVPQALQLPSHGQAAVGPVPASLAAPAYRAEPLPPAVHTIPSRAPASRWSGSVWLLVRHGRAGPLAPGGTLGGSQAGGRLVYRVAGGLDRPLALSARLSGPLGRRAGTEAALGLEWRPSAALPFSLLAERRQALGREARSAFALAVHGGVSRHQVARGVTLDGFAQAGIVGARSRDLFADGSASLSVGSGRVEIGAGVWGGAQPGAARLDLGPRLSVRLPASAGSLRLSAEWRFRVAGEARPGSGPALTLGAGF